MRKDVYTLCRTRRSSQSRTWSSGFVQASALQSPTDDAGDFEGQCETRLGGGAAPITNPAQRGRETLFPSGIPASEEIIRAINSWLDEAERLAQMK